MTALMVAGLWMAAAGGTAAGKLPPAAAKQMPEAIVAHMKSYGAKGAVRPEVSGVLDCHAIVRLEQRRGSEAQRSLRPRHDEDLIRHAPYGARRSQMLCNRHPQASQSGRVAVGQAHTANRPIGR